MRLDEKSIGNNGSKSAQCGDESELPEFFAKIEPRDRVRPAL
jgi:hypothetical protein